MEYYLESITYAASFLGKTLKNALFHLYNVLKHPKKFFDSSDFSLLI